MHLPNAENAIIDLHKLTGYVLDANNVRGQHKAKVMAAALGVTIENAEELKTALLRAVLTTECVARELDFYGQRYRVDCKIKTGIGEATVRTGWIIRRGEKFPRLTTCFVRNEKKQK